MHAADGPGTCFPLRRRQTGVQTRAAEAGALRVTDVHLEVGEGSGIDTTSIELHWPLLSRGSVADGARSPFDDAATPFTFRLTSIEVDEAD